MVNVVIVTGSAGLVGSEACRFFHAKGFAVVGIDNNMRQTFFGPDGSTDWNRKGLEEALPNYNHLCLDVCDGRLVGSALSNYGSDVKVVIHTAAQPSHDWSAKDPVMDFSVNAIGTLMLLEAVRKNCPDAVFIFTSTNKVYGEHPNLLPLVEHDTRWSIEPGHRYAKGIDESMSVDQTRHSAFGASKLAADVMVQEYARYFGMKTGVFRCGCITGPNHAGVRLHGFLSYLTMKAICKEQYTIYGYKGKQVRDNLHAFDLARMFWEFYQAPHPGEVYNAGGGDHSNCSVLEAIGICEKRLNRKMTVTYSDTPRVGDHIWWISDISKFRRDFPQWQYKYKLEEIFDELLK
jgi:CDP-paratose 2-epimerase